jgi:protoporphyrinogen/coproporphyrinogen III oxidase
VRAPGGAYRVLLSSGGQLEADAVIVATPASAAATLLGDVAPVAASHLRAIRSASIGNVYLTFRREGVPHPLNGYGVVIPRGEGRRIDGMSWTSSKWTGRAPAQHVLLRVFFGGPHTRAQGQLADDELLAVIREEVAALLGVRATPVFRRVHRWGDGYPQYEVGHLARVSAIETALPDGVMVTGSAYCGIGVPDCIRQGQEAAQRALAALTVVSAATSGAATRLHER